MKKWDDPLVLRERDALNQLIVLSQQRKLERYKNVPREYVPTTRFESKTANGLTRCVTAWLELNNHYCVRVNTTGRKLRDTTIVDVLGHAHVMPGKWIPGTTKRGTADLHSSIKGRHVSIEIKIADQQSRDQKETQRQVEKSEGVYIVARSFAQFLDWYRDFVDDDAPRVMIKSFCK